MEEDIGPPDSDIPFHPTLDFKLCVESDFEGIGWIKDHVETPSKPQFPPNPHSLYSPVPQQSNSLAYYFTCCSPSNQNKSASKIKKKLVAMHPSSANSILILLSAVSFVCATPSVGDKNVFCTRANITGVRIEGCETEPCDVKKGVKIPIEVEFDFQAPDSLDKIGFGVFVPYWNVPDTGAFGSYIAAGKNCDELKLQSCPAVAFTTYTLKSQLYVDPKLESSIGLGPTGEVNTSWTLSLSNQDNFSHCMCEVLINIVE